MSRPEHPTLTLWRRLWTIALPTIALGCATPLPEDPEQWPATQLKPGSVFYLNRDISIEPRLLDIGPGTVHFQGGRIMAQPHLDRYETYCLFLLNQTAAKPVLLESDAFIVTAVNSGLERSQRLEDNPIRLAANGNLSGLMLAEQRGLDTVWAVSKRFLLRKFRWCRCQKSVSKGKAKERGLATVWAVANRCLSPVYAGQNEPIPDNHSDFHSYQSGRRPVMNNCPRFSPVKMNLFPTITLNPTNT